MVMNAAGGPQTNVTNTASTAEIAPAWSPDGSRIAFTEFGPGGPYLSTMNRDGSNRVRLTTMNSFEYTALTDPTGKNWSPDGTKIAFRDPDGFISVINTDGTGQTRLTSVMGSHPSWAPNGTRIAFAAYFPGDPPNDHPDEIYVMKADGSEPTRLTENTVLDHSPAWSPDGTRIAFSSLRTGSVQIHSMNPDGSDVQQVTTASSLNSDWQPIPVNSYARPKGATPLRASLVRAFAPCTAPYMTHGPPLAYGSCGTSTGQPWHGISQNVTIGSPDYNGVSANFVGLVRMDAAAGNPATAADEADVNVTVSATDLRCFPMSAMPACTPQNSAAGADYTGEMRGELSLRITDKNNSPDPGGAAAGTVQDAVIGFAIPCAATSDTLQGALCSLTSSMDALVPGTVLEGRRSIWQLGQIQVFDGGPDADADTANNSLFATQGIFVP